MQISQKKQGASSPVPDLVLNNQTLQRVNTYKYLGLLFSQDLSWSEHIRIMCNKGKAAAWAPLP